MISDSFNLIGKIIIYLPQISILTLEYYAAMYHQICVCHTGCINIHSPIAFSTLCMTLYSLTIYDNKQTHILVLVTIITLSETLYHSKHSNTTNYYLTQYPFLMYTNIRVNILFTGPIFCLT